MPMLSGVTSVSSIGQLSGAPSASTLLSTSTIRLGSAPAPRMFAGPGSMGVPDFNLVAFCILVID